MDKYISFKFTNDSISAVILAYSEGNATEELYEYSKPIPDRLLDPALGADLENKNFYSLWLASEKENTEYLSEVSEFREELIDELKSFIAPHSLDIVGSLMIIPAKRYLSLVTKLPFDDPKIINRIIQQDVQDKVPFDLADFKISYKVLGSNEEGSYDIHIGICPEYIIKFCLDIAKSLDLTVQHICTRADLLRAVSEDPYLINFSADEKNIYLKAYVDGEPVGLNIVNKKNLKNQAAFLKSIVAYYQQQFSSQFKVLESKGEEDLSLSTSLVSQDNHQLLADFGDKNYLWTNLFKFLQVAFINAKYVVLAILLLIFIYPAIQIGANNFLINKTQKAISKNLIERIPQVKFPKEKELDYLITQNALINQQLEKLGNPSSNNPFDVYGIVAEILNKATSASTQMDLQALKIIGDKITFSGTVPIYKGVDRIERLLKNRDNLFCDIDKETPGSSGSNTRFIFRLRLCA